MYLWMALQQPLGLTHLCPCHPQLAALAHSHCVSIACFLSCCACRPVPVIASVSVTIGTTEFVAHFCSFCCFSCRMFMSLSFVCYRSCESSGHWCVCETPKATSRLSPSPPTEPISDAVHRQWKPTVHGTSYSHIPHKSNRYRALSILSLFLCFWGSINLCCSLDACLRHYYAATVIQVALLRTALSVLFHGISLAGFSFSLSLLIYNQLSAVVCVLFFMITCKRCKQAEQW